MLLFGVLLVPLVAAVQALLARDGRSASRGAVIAAVVATLGAGALAGLVFLSGELWFGGYGMLDRFSALMVVLIQIVWLGAALSSVRYIGIEEASGILSVRKVRLYYALLPVFVLAMLVTVTTDHLGVLWLGLEATTLATTPLVALYRKDGAIEAAWKYLLLCSLGISVSLLGLVLLAYAGVGAGLPVDQAFSLGALRGRAAALDPQVVRWAFVFLFVGIGTKVGFVPMHPWLPDAHSRTPSPISASLSGVLLNVALYALLRAKAVTDLALGQGEWTSRFFWAFGLLSVLFAAFVLLHQQNYKRMLAYHSVEHMGLISFGLGMGPLGSAGAVMHMIGHTLAKSALFFSAGEILLRTHTTKIANIRGLWRQAPRTSLAFLLGFLGLIGAPTSIIFASELTFLVAAARRSPASAVAIIVALAIVAVGVLHHIFSMLFGGDAHARPEEAPPPERFTVTHAVLAVELALLFGGGVFFLTRPGFELAASIARVFTVKP
ncbi:MAG TPA: proton-conducting transporter membrane subunit [Vicinamibacterales bacterium]|jgi:hydrogenase-4 component F